MKIGEIFVIFLIFIFIISLGFSLIIVGDSSYNSTDTNITQEAGFAHLTLSNLSYYQYLVGYWSFDELTGTAVHDMTNSSYDGMLKGHAIFNTSGLYGNGVSFDGSGDYINLNNNLALNFSGLSDNFTISVWFKADGGSLGAIVAKRCGPTADTIQYEIYLDPITGNVTGRIGGADGIDSRIAGNDSQWHHAVLVNYNNAGVQTGIIYVDGVQTGDSIASGGNFSGANLTMGARFTTCPNTDLTYKFSGIIDDVMMFNSNLSSVEISEIYNNQSSRFVPFGTQLFTNLNISSTTTGNLLNLTLKAYSNNQNTNISMKINNGNYSNLTNGYFYNYNFSGDPNYINLTLLYLSNSYKFYSPFIFGNITITSNEISTDGISFSYPSQYALFQRNDITSGDIVIVGNYTGSPTAIDARFNGGAWITINSTPLNNNFRGVLTNQLVGQGILELRFANNYSINNSIGNISIGDLYVLGGASQMAGRGTYLQTLNTSSPYLATVFRFDNAWTIANDPLHSQANNGSYAVLIANYIVDNARIPIGFISTAVSGDTIIQWNGTGKTSYDNMITQVKMATNGTMKVKTMLYNAGGNEAANGLSYNASKDAHSRMAGDFVRDTNISTEILIIEKESRLTGVTRDKLDAIKKSQTDLWWEDNNVSYGGNIYDVPLSDDDIHFKDNSSLQTVAQRWWASINANYYNTSADGLGPSFIKAAYTNSTRVIVVLNDSSLPLVNITGGTDNIKGFFIRDNAQKINLTDLNISSATIFDSNKVVLLLSYNISTTANISYASFNDAYNTSILTDNSTYHLPTQTFYYQPILADTVSPYFTTTQSSLSIYLGSSVNVTFTGKDDIEFGTYSINNTENFSINSNGNLYNITVLPLGTYNINVTINDSSNNINSTIFTITVSNTPPGSVIVTSGSRGGGGGIVLKNNLSNNDTYLNATYPKIWNKNSEVEMVLQFFNKSHALYYPNSVRFSYIIEGVNLKEIKKQSNGEMVALFSISSSAKSGMYQINMTVEDKEISNYQFNISIANEQLTNEVIDKKITWIIQVIILAIIICILLLIIILLRLMRKKNKLKRRHFSR